MSNPRTNFVGSISILDRGDAPAQEVIDKNARSLAQRVTDETKSELQQVMTRVETIYGSFEMSQDIFNNMTNLEYVNDVSELEAILKDQVKKKKYQQQVTIFIVGYEDTCTQKLRLLQQLNEFFMENSKNNEDEELRAQTPDIDLENVGVKIEDSLATAAELTQRIGDLNKEMIDYVANYTANKASNRGRKKLEKSLQQAKDDAAALSEKLLSVHAELEDKEERITQLYKQLETKNLELTRFRNIVDISKKKVDECDAIKEQLNSKHEQIQEQQKTITHLETELASINFSQSQAESRLENYNIEYQQKINDLQSQLENSTAIAEESKKDLEKFHNQQVIALHAQHGEKVKELNSDHSEEMKVLNEEITSLQGQLAEAQQEIASLRVLQSKQETPVQEVDFILSSEDVSHVSSEPESRPSTKGAGKASKGTGKSHKLPASKSKEKPKEEVPEVPVPDEIVAPVEEVKPVKAKSNLEPTFADSFDLFDNVAWGSVPPKEVRGRFDQYRNLTQDKVRELEEQIELTIAKTKRKVNTLKSQFLEHKSKWEKERKILIEQVDQAHVLQTEAEKEADAAMFHLEEFINEQEQLDEQEEKKRQELTASAEASSLGGQGQPPASPLETEPTDTSTTHPPPITAEGTEIELEELIQQTDDAKFERERTRSSLQVDAPENHTSPRPQSESISARARSSHASIRDNSSRLSTRSQSRLVTPRNPSAGKSVSDHAASRVQSRRSREPSELSIHLEVGEEPPKLLKENSLISNISLTPRKSEPGDPIIEIIPDTEQDVTEFHFNTDDFAALSEVQEMNARMAGSGAVSAPPAVESSGQDEHLGKVPESCSTPLSQGMLPLMREKPISPSTVKNSWCSGDEEEDSVQNRDAVQSLTNNDVLVLGIAQEENCSEGISRMSLSGETRIVIDSSQPGLTLISVIPQGNHQKQICINVRHSSKDSNKRLCEENTCLSRAETPALNQLTDSEKCHHYLMIKDDKLSYMDTPGNIVQLLHGTQNKTKHLGTTRTSNSDKNSQDGTYPGSAVSEETVSGKSVSFSTPNGSTVSVITPVGTALSIRNQSSGYKTMHIKSLLSDNGTSSPLSDKFSLSSRKNSCMMSKLQPEQMFALKNLKELMIEDNLPEHLQQILQALRSALQILHTNGHELSDEQIARTLLIVSLAEQLIQESIQLGVVPKSLLVSLANVSTDYEAVLNRTASHKNYIREQKTSEKICRNYAEKLQVQKNLKNLPDLDVSSMNEHQELERGISLPYYPTETTIGTIVPREFTASPDNGYISGRRKTEFILEDLFLFRGPMGKKMLEPLGNIRKHSARSASEQELRNTNPKSRNKMAGLRKEKTDMSEVSVKSRASIRNMYRSKLEDTRTNADERKSKSPLLTPRTLLDEEEEEEDLPFPDDLQGNQMTDIGTSPISKQASSIKKPSFILFDHPVVQEYLKSYDGVVSFKNSMSKIMLDRDMMSAAQILADLEPISVESNDKVQPQIEKMTKNLYLILEEVTNVVSSLLYSERFVIPHWNELVSLLPNESTKSVQHKTQTFLEPVVSSLMMVSREPTLVGTNQDVEKTVDSYHTTGATRAGLRSGVSVQSDLSTKLTVQDLKNQYERLEKKHTDDAKKYENQLKHNTALMKNMQGTINDLQRELSNLGKRKKSADLYQSLSSPSVDSSIMFTRLDSERNAKIMKRAVMDEKLKSDNYKKATAKMSEYVSLPARRFGHLVKKYIHHCRMKGIENKVKKSRSLDDNVFETLDKMEELQNRRAKRWAEKMDEMGEERLHLASQLMDTFDMIEQESGVFLIKPVYSYRGTNVRDSKHVGKMNRPYRQTREFSSTGRESSFAPAPTPASNIRFIKQHDKPTGPADPLMVRREPLRKLEDNDPGIFGSSMDTGGYQSTWNMSLSHEKGDTSQPLPLNAFNTPRLLEIDINRMLISQNNISNQVHGAVSDDRLINATQNSTRGFVAVNRPTVQMPQQKERPSSGGGESKGQQNDVPLSATSQKRVQLVDGEVNKSFPGSTPLPPIVNSGPDKQTASPQWCA